MKRWLIIFTVIIILILVIAGTFLTGLYVGYKNVPAIDKVTVLSGKEEGQPTTVDFSLFWKAWNILDEQYVDTNATSTEKSITAEERVWGAIAGLASSFGDPYTVFLPPEERKQFEDDIHGSFSGVGMEIGIRNNQLVIISPLSNTPAKKAGLKAGDRIIEIDGQSTVDLSVAAAAGKIRGQKGTPVTIAVLRGEDNERLEFKIIRDDIEIPTIETELLPENIFVIKLFNFSAVAPNLFRQALIDFADSNTDKLIIDLRGNPGGFLDGAIYLSSWFLPSDKIIVKEIKGKNKEEIIHKSLGFDVFTDQLKLVILVDQGSASASEIMAGALRDHGIATLIGQETFGKGSVQELIPLTGETSLKVTIARWLTPAGHSISENGLKPDIEVKITAKDIQNNRDPQLARAKEYLLTGQ